MSKQPLLFWYRVAMHMKSEFPKVPIAIMQEDDIDTIYHPDRIHEGARHILSLQRGEFDVIFCHNESSKNFYQGVTKKPVFILPTAYPIKYVRSLKEKEKGNEK